MVARTLEQCRAMNRITGITERYIAHAHCRSDLFGFVDLISIDPVHGIVAIQVCASGERLAHLRKIASEPQRSKCIAWLKVHGRVELWCWSQRVMVRGGKKRKWVPVIYEITLESFDEESVA